MADFDVVVLGGGPGGYAAALYGSSAGLRMALVDQRKPGGTCLHVGCIPAKELLQTAEVYRTVAHAAAFGVHTEPPTINWSESLARKQQVVDKLVGGLGGLLKQRKVEVIEARGSVSAPGVVKTDEGEIAGDALIVATGSAPKPIPGFAFDGETILSSDHALSISDLPTSIVVIGAGAVGAELASVLTDLGSETALLEALPQVIPGSDADAAKVLDRSLKKRGTRIEVGVKVTGWEKGGPGAVVTYEAAGTAKSIEVEKVLVATGRGPVTAGVGLEEIGVKLDQRGFVDVDPTNLRTAVPKVWALGDCIATPGLAHVAFAEAMVAIRDIKGEAARPLDYGKVPWVVYTHPELAWVGLTEAQAKDQGIEVEVHRHNFGGVGRAIIIGETDGFVKLIARAGGGPLIGAHYVGPWASELLSEGYMAVNWEATGADIGHFTHAHPSLAEAMGEAALAFTGRSLH